MSKRKNSDKSCGQPAKRQKLTHNVKTKSESKLGDIENDSDNKICNNKNNTNKSLIGSSKLIYQDYYENNDKNSNNNYTCDCVQVHCVEPIERKIETNDTNNNNGNSNSSNSSNSNKNKKNSIFAPCVTVVAPKPSIYPSQTNNLLKNSNKNSGKQKLRRSKRNKVLYVSQLNEN